ncbi:hypothetical protein [Arsukibacterium indicum]|uniref:DNA-binding protein n=1 Tax=Arsukibacterium indicum TaxID=2848612 RepID=A0ABS6MHB5_9GAMM|nr:hypothetical protein [Arsukibacterium indicum]MBV2128184.1 hypothetical protein [Arsukibacterium indicum]
MRDYAKIGPQFWIGRTGKELRKRGPECQVVAMYLISSPHSNMLGLYYLPKMFIAHETGLSMDGACKGLLSAIEAGFCQYDDDSEMVWVPEMARYQIADALKPADKRCAGVQNEYNALPTNPFLSAFYDKYATAFCMTVKRNCDTQNVRGLQGASKPHRSQEQEQEQEQDIALSNAQEQNSPPADKSGQPSTVDNSHNPADNSCTGEQLAFDEQHLRLARTTGINSDYSDDDIGDIFDLFRCYKANANTLKTQSDWLNAWRTWCQREKVNYAKSNKKSNTGGRAARPENNTQLAMRLAREAAERIAASGSGSH